MNHTQIPACGILLATMRLDLVIPAYNEEEIIFETVSETQQTMTSFPHEVSIVVANNGSTDQTARRATDAGARVIEVPIKGKGAALAHAARESVAPLFAFIDADLSAHPRDIHTLHTALVSSGADIVIGSRLLDQGTVDRGYMRTLTSRIFNTLRKLFLGIQVRDTQCGLKLMNEKGRAVLAHCEEVGWFFDMEFLARAERAGLRIIEVPIPWEEFRYPDRGSKLNVLFDGYHAVLAMARIRRNLKK